MTATRSHSLTVCLLAPAHPLEQALPVLGARAAGDLSVRHNEEAWPVVRGAEGGRCDHRLRCCCGYE
eukprot:CAMPEP_0196752876 /NCGR_PEP_ID=MMETSP1091-20130531/88706_1 /TAXON_ID=302021 /ORGANISM="Rhodomonas sp., Strain CCMP768" /LENGTH=66 /DNA_ID=CAMNT_0042100895 /DNA_START=214 /DNA_END=412 /DNA_ORIENTATION=+